MQAHCSCCSMCSVHTCEIVRSHSRTVFCLRKNEAYTSTRIENAHSARYVVFKQHKRCTKINPICAWVCVLCLIVDLIFRQPAIQSTLIYCELRTVVYKCIFRIRTCTQTRKHHAYTKYIIKIMHVRATQVSINEL